MKERGTFYIFLYIIVIYQGFWVKKKFLLKFHEGNLDGTFSPDYP